MVVHINRRSSEFPVEAISQIIALGGAGNDRIAVGSRLSIDARIDGGDVDDVLSGGRGNDILTGGPGDDQLSGALGRDLLIGGLGRDTLSSGTSLRDFQAADQTDIIIPGFWSHGTTDAVLENLLNQWEGADDVASRIDRLSHGSNGLPPLAANTIVDDQALDTILADLRGDWVLWNPLSDRLRKSKGKN